ncbi:MAG: phosphodiester glycosidase family protein [Longimicrobiales bacterium]
MPIRPARVACTMVPLLTGACALVGGRSAPPSSAELALTRADSFRTERIQDGVRYFYAWQRTGPWAIHVLQVDRRCRPLWQARTSGPPITNRATTTALSFNALAAVNADFFALPQGTPVGAHVTGSEVLVGPAERRVALLVAGNRSWIDSTRLDARIAGSRTSASLAQVNRPRPASEPAAVRLFTHWFGARAPADSMVLSVRVRLLARGRGVVELIDSVGNSIWLDTTHVVIHFPRKTTVALADTLRWSAALRSSSMTQAAQEAVGGFPWLLRNGQQVLGAQPGVPPDFGERRHPRTAIGFTRDGSALLVVVDGRRPRYSDGMTLPELTDLLVRLGAVDALNLDGGGSSSLAIRGRVRNSPSDSAGERAVGNALTLVRCR